MQLAIKLVKVREWTTSRRRMITYACCTPIVLDGRSCVSRIRQTVPLLQLYNTIFRIVMNESECIPSRDVIKTYL